MVKHTLKILQHLLQDFQRVSNHFETFKNKNKNFCMKKTLRKLQGGHFAVNFAQLLNIAYAQNPVFRYW